MVAEQVPVHGHRHERGGIDELPVWPIGMIGIWDDELEALPSGFVLCDGENGTPDLRGLMVLGAGGDYARGDTGGEAEQTLNHTGTAVSAHTGTAVSLTNNHSGGGVQNHTHGHSMTESTIGVQAGADGIALRLGTTIDDDTHNHGFTNPTAHGVNVTQPGNHTVTQPNSHTVETLPPFHALYFVKRIA